MARKRRTEPRKTPAQRRGYETIDRILDETARILELDGYGGLNTNAVAAAAGLSVGSVYQYFPNKDSIITALAARSLDEAADRIVECLESPRLVDAPLDHVVRATIDDVLATIDSSRLHSLLALEAGRSTALDAATERFDHRTAAALAAHVRRCTPSHDPADAHLRSQLAIASADAALHRVVLALPDADRADAVGTLVSMVTAMLLAPGSRLLAGSGRRGAET
jgi:AcrR family transcriptional regulator